MDHTDWYDPAHPPTEATDHGHGVWSSWARPWTDPEASHPLVWHWCDRSVWKAQRDQSQEVGSKTNRLSEWYEPQWVPAGCGTHQILSRDPLHLEPSLLLPDCCGLHGFLREGRWQPV